MIILILVLTLSLMIEDINCLKLSNSIMNKMIAKTLVMMTILNQQPSYGDDFDNNIESNTNNNDISMIVPSRKTVIKLSDDEMNVKINPNEQVESIDEVLKLIPSWKYFKIIAKEYRFDIIFFIISTIINIFLSISSRSTNYKEGQENFAAPFM